MLNRITPTIDQMRRLQSLGDGCDGAGMVYHPVSAHSDIFRLEVADVEYAREFWSDPRRAALVGEGYFSRIHGRDVPAYTADDLMARLPESLVIGGIPHRLFIGSGRVDDLLVFVASYSFKDSGGRPAAMRRDARWESTAFVQLLYAVYLWCIENRYVNPATGGVSHIPSCIAQNRVKS